MTPERFTALARDVLCMTLPWVGIAWQAYTGVIHAELLTLYLGLLTWSGAANIWAARPRRGGPGSWSSSQQPGSPPPPVSSAAPSGGGET